MLKCSQGSTFVSLRVPSYTQVCLPCIMDICSDTRVPFARECKRFQFRVQVHDYHWDLLLSAQDLVKFPMSGLKLPQVMLSVLQKILLSVHNRCISRRPYLIGTESTEPYQWWHLRGARFTALALGHFWFLNQTPPFNNIITGIGFIQSCYQHLSDWTILYRFD